MWMQRACKCWPAWARIRTAVVETRGNGGTGPLCTRLSRAEQRCHSDSREIRDKLRGSHRRGKSPLEFWGDHKDTSKLYSIHGTHRIKDQASFTLCHFKLHWLDLSLSLFFFIRPKSDHCLALSVSLKSLKVSFCSCWLAEFHKCCS